MLRGNGLGLDGFLLGSVDALDAFLALLFTEVH